MKVVKNPRNFLEEIGRWAYPETPEGKRAADITTLVLMGVALIGLVWSMGLLILLPLLCLFVGIFWRLARWLGLLWGF